MKSTRQARIREIIETEIIETQEELAASLRAHHIAVTQATVSRDIKELMLIKIPTGDGRYRYAFPKDNKPFFSKDRMERMFHASVTSVDYGENIIVLKTLPGTANAVASTIDGASWPEIIGTLAGDENILVVMKPKEAAPAIADKMKTMFK